MAFKQFKTEIKVEGTKEVAKAINKIYGKARDEIKSELLKGGQTIFKEAQEHVPIDTGNLAGSGYARFDQSSEPAVVVGYEAGYALYVHENVDANFQRPAATAKWLENSFKKNGKGVIDKVARIIEKVTR